MPRRQIRIITCIPGAAHLRPILREFLQKGPGWLTSFSDMRLRSMARTLELETDAVKPFGEVVGEMLTRLRGQKLPIAQAGHVKAAVAAACHLLPEDSVFGPSAHFSGTHRAVASTLGELRHWGLDADDLASAAEQASGTLAAKLESLAFVEREVSQSLRAIARERASDRIAASLNLAEDGTDLGRVLIVCGSEFVEQHVAWVKWAFATGLDVTLVADRADGPLFRNLHTALARLGAPIEAIGTANRLQAGLFGGDTLGLNSRTGSSQSEKNAEIRVRIESSADMLAESEWALRSILGQLKLGVEPSRIAIFCRDEEAYLPLVQAAANRFEIPVSCSRRVPLLSNSFARFVLGILEFCASKDVRSLAPSLKSSYLHMDGVTRSAMEQALKEAFLGQESQWQVLENWSRDHSQDIGWLLSLLEWRKRWIQEPAPLHAWCDRLLEFGQQPWHDEALAANGSTGVRDQYAQSAMQRSLAQYASIERTFSAPGLNLVQFVSTCRQIWDESDVSAPFDPLAVQVVASTLEIGDVQTLYVLGLLEGVFPRRRSEEPILSDEERAGLSALFPEKLPFPDSHTKALGERDEFYRLCGMASDSLILSYPQTDDDRDNVPAFYLTEVKRALDMVTELDHLRSNFAPEDSPATVDGKLREAMLIEPHRQPLPNTLEQEEAKDVIRTAAARSVTPKALGDVLECPFRYLAETALALSPNRRRSRWHHLYRLPSRTGLASLPFRESAEKALKAALDPEIDRLLADASLNDLAMMRAGGERLIEEWLEREYASRELWPRDSIQQEPSFERGDLKSKMKAAEGSVLLHGSFPALSHRNGYRILHLFRASEPWSESGSREEDPWGRLTEKDAFELGLYLAALWRPEEPRVGIEIDSASGARNLFLLPRPDEQVRNDQAHSFKVTIIDDDRRSDLFRRVGESVRKGLSRLAQADVEAHPDDYCSNCEYGELCRRSQDFGEETDPFEEDYS